MPQKKSKLYKVLMSRPGAKMTTIQMRKKVAKIEGLKSWKDVPYDKFPVRKNVKVV